MALTGGRSVLASSASSADDDEDSDALSHWRAHRVSLRRRQIPIWKAGAACGSRLQEAFARGSRLQESFALGSRLQEPFAAGERGGRRLHFRVMTPPRARRHEIGRAACVPLPGEDRSVTQRPLKDTFCSAGHSENRSSYFSAMDKKLYVTVFAHIAA